jgi:hypothetical protein
VAPCGCSSAGQSIGLPSRRSRVRSPSSAPSPSSPTVRGAALRPQMIRVRIPGRVRKESEPDRACRASLLTSALPQGGGLRLLRSPPWMADRVGKVPGRKPEVTATSVDRFESCAIRFWMTKLSRDSRPFEAGWVRRRAGGRVLRHPRREDEAARVAATALKAAGRGARWGSCPPSSAGS